MEVSEEEASGAGRSDSHSPAPDGDLNTSTEAVLDMIDEFVDGPAAVRRLPPFSDLPTSPGPADVPIAAATVRVESPLACKSESESSETSSIAPAPSEAPSDHPLIEASRQDEVPQSAKSPERLNSDDTEVDKNIGVESVSSNSEVGTASESAVKVEECESSVRMLANNTSSERREIVTVGSAQSTSNDAQIAECQFSGDLTPRRRLVRLPPNERRPESTVTSTADSMSTVSGSTDRVMCEIQKDVSSSSDAVCSNMQSVSDNVQTLPDDNKPTVCRAEPSSSPPKKVKLVRSSPVKRASISSVASDSTSEETPMLADSGIVASRNSDFSVKLGEVQDSRRHDNDNEFQEQTTSEKHQELKSEAIPISNSEGSDIVSNPHSNISSIPLVLENSISNSVISPQCSTVKHLQNETEQGASKVVEPSIVVNVSSATEISEPKCGNDSTLDLIDASVQECPKLVPKLTLKLSNKVTEELKCTVPKLTIKPIQPEENICQPSSTRSQEPLKWSENQVPNVTKLNIKPLLKPCKVKSSTSESSENDDGPTTSDKTLSSEQVNLETVPKVTIKLNKQGNESEMKSHSEHIPKLTIKNIHRSEQISEDEQIPKLTLKIPKEGDTKHSDKIPKLTIKTVLKAETRPISPKHSMKVSKQEKTVSKLENQPKLIVKISNQEKNTIKTESQPMSPKLLLKTTKSEGTVCEILESKVEAPSIPKLTIKSVGNPADNVIYSADKSDNLTVPKITIKPVVRTDETFSKNSKRLESEELDTIPIVTKINIKPIKKPADLEESSSSDGNSEHEVPTVSKLNIKPLKRPEDSECVNIVDSTVVDTPKIPKMNIKHIFKSVDSAQCSLKISDSTESTSKAENIPIVTKLNIKPIKLPAVENVRETRSMTKSPDSDKAQLKIVEKLCETENIPVVTKLHIKPIAKPPDMRNNVNHGERSDDETEQYKELEEKIPTVTKINIKPITKPLECENDGEKKIEKSLNNEAESITTDSKFIDNFERSERVVNCHFEDSASNVTKHFDISGKAPLVTKITIKPVTKPRVVKHEKSDESDGTSDDSTSDENIPAVAKLNIKPIVKPIPETGNEGTKEIPCVQKIPKKPITKNSEDDVTTNVDSLCKETTRENDICMIEKIADNVAVPAVKKINVKLTPKTSEIDQLLTPQAAPDDLKNDLSDAKIISKLKIKPLVQPNVICEAKPEELTEIKIVEKTDRKLNSERVNEDSTAKTTEKSSVQKTVEVNSEKKEIVSESCDTKQQEKYLITKIKIKPIEEPNEFENKNINNIQNDLQHISNHLSERETCSGEEIFESKETLESVIDNVIANDLENKIDHSSLKDALEKKEVKMNDYNVNEDVKTSAQHVSVETSQRYEAAKRKFDSQEISPIPEKISKSKIESALLQELNKPLEINTSCGNKSPGQGSPHIKIKINKTNQGPIAEILMEKPVAPPQDTTVSESTCSTNEIQKILKEHSEAQSIPGNKSKVESNLLTTGAPVGKRLRSSRLMNELQSDLKKTPAKRPSAKELALNRQKEAKAILHSKRMKLDKLLSNSTLTITTLPSNKTSPQKVSTAKFVALPDTKNDNCSVLNNENCSKNGDSKLHSILTSLHAKCEDREIVALEKSKLLIQDVDSNSTTSSAEASFTEMGSQISVHIKSHEMILNEASNLQESNTSEDFSQDPLDLASAVSSSEPISIKSEPVSITSKPVSIGESIPETPQPKKRGRPRKYPLPQDIKKPEPAIEKESPKLPTTALEERRQRSLRLAINRDQTPTPVKSRGRGRGRRGARTSNRDPATEPVVTPEQPCEDVDPMSSRIKLPRLTEALEKIPHSTPNSRLDSSDFEPDAETFEAPETPKRGKGLRGRGSRGGRYIRTRVRGRGKVIGGGRGATYMKETQGIYERVCGPTTSNVELFEEETCMMDDNATSSSTKMSHLLDEDSQTSTHSATNDSSKAKKLKFSELFDGNKVWSAADVKEYMWPSQDKCTSDTEPRVMMIQEQVAMFLGVKSFKRRYPELKRRTVAAEEREHVLSLGIVTEELCDLGITAVDASEVLDIMLSDYPHKYEEYRSHQRQREVAAAAVAPPPPPPPAPDPPPVEEKEEKKEREVKPEKESVPEKSRQDIAAAAALAASEFNARLNSLRMRACADMQSLCIQRRRPPPCSPVPEHVRPPGGYYPLSLLPGQFAEPYQVYTPHKLRCLPLNTVMDVPPQHNVDDSDRSDGESADEFTEEETSCDSNMFQRKRLLKVKRGSQAEEGAPDGEPGAAAAPAGLCKHCGKEENPDKPNDAYLHCSKCRSRAHPSCLEFGAETTLRCRNYKWVCAECKCCYTCERPADDDKMLFCDLCDRGHHIYCVGLTKVPNGRWHCKECAICKSCGSRSPSGLAGAAPAAGDAPDVWHHQMKKGSTRQYSHSLCVPCARLRESVGRPT